MSAKRRVLRSLKKELGRSHSSDWRLVQAEEPTAAEKTV